MQVLSEKVSPLPAFRAMFFNVGNDLLRPDRLILAVEQSQADLIGLAELTTLQAEALRGLNELYPYQHLYGTGIPGKGILSKIPLHGAELIELYPARPDLRTHIRLASGSQEQELQVIVAHPPPQRTRLRTLQLYALIRHVTMGQPSLLMGDFNMVQYQAAYRSFVTAGLVDSFREVGAGRGFTYPVRRGGIRLRPLLRIDMIWHTRHLYATRAWVGADYGSDHLPIFAELTV
jgi:endonuclease/exonuclease/phosphatase family metal-dependent hydrolase